MEVIAVVIEGSPIISVYFACRQVHCHSNRGSQKGVSSNLRIAIDSDRLKVGTIRKGIIPNARHAVRDSDRLKTTTSPKGFDPYVRHAVRDSD